MEEAIGQGFHLLFDLYLAYQLIKSQTKFDKTKEILMINKEWDPNLTPEQNYVLKQEGTESPGSSPLNHEKREGSYHCVGCGTKLFESTTKYESGSGWPSFFESIPGVFEEKKDMHIGYPRTEYHCKKCGGHHGHVFDDGPKPTGKRYCNNGICLVFKPKGE